MCRSTASSRTAVPSQPGLEHDYPRHDHCATCCMLTCRSDLAVARSSCTSQSLYLRKGCSCKCPTSFCSCKCPTTSFCSICNIHLKGLMVVAAGNGTAVPAAQSKPTVNGRSPAAPVQQWQAPQAAPPVQDPTPSSDTAKMSPEFKVMTPHWLSHR